MAKNNKADDLISVDQATDAENSDQLEQFSSNKKLVEEKKYQGSSRNKDVIPPSGRKLPPKAGQRPMIGDATQAEVE